MTSGRCEIRYVAAGGVVVDQDRVLVLDRPGRDEVRLPKGHVEPGESVERAAVREVSEESGFVVSIVSDLGEQIVEFDHEGRRWIRTERYFLMTLDDPSVRASTGEVEFHPAWVRWDDAEQSLTFEAEREWVRRARTICAGLAPRKRFS